MNDMLLDLTSQGLELPSPAYLFGSVLFSIVGIAAWRHAKRADKRLGRWLAGALMIYPYFVSSTWLLYAVGAGLCVALYLDPT